MPLETLSCALEDRGALIRFRTLPRSIAYTDIPSQPATGINKLTAREA